MTAAQFGECARADLAEITAAYRRDSIVRIADFLPSSAAAALHAVLRGSTEWRRVLNGGEKLFEFDRRARDAMAPSAAAALDEAVYAGARRGFQYRYETIRVPDEAIVREKRADLLAQFATWMSSGGARDVFREITGVGEIAFADAQATAYSPGDFLTGHDDAVPGKQRAAAYTFGLTPHWRIEWGGLLLFHGRDGEVARAYPPAMNVLTLFRVPRMHSVSEVTRAAAYRRYTITGWLRC